MIDTDMSMELSKYIKYAAIGIVGFVVAGEIYYQLVCKIREKLAIKKDSDILEIVFCRDGINDSMANGIALNQEMPSTHSQEYLVAYIMSAQQSIQVAMYIFTNKMLGEALINAHKKGVKVSVVVDQSMENSAGSKIHELHDQGIPIRVSHDGTMHLKMCLIDVPFEPLVKRIMYTKAPRPSDYAPIVIPKTGVTITGSLNWTREALLNNEENFIISSNHSICETSATKWYKIWNASAPLYNH